MRRIAKLAFMHNLSATFCLGLNAQPPKSSAGWETYCSTFYTNLLKKEDWIWQMSLYNKTKENIEKAEAVFKEEVELNKIALQKKGELHRCSKERKKIFEDLNEWLKTFDRIAKQALQSTPQLLEILGIEVNENNIHKKTRTAQKQYEFLMWKNSSD